MTMECQSAQPLIPGYVDGELSDHQATPLRQHLMDCPSCRATMQEMKNLHSWFVDDEEFEVPVGFAARVTRRALAGDTGISEELTALPGSGAAPALSDPDLSHEAPERRLFDFVLHLTAAAALVLFTVSLAMQREDRPMGLDVHADDVFLNDALEGLDALNEPALEEGDETQPTPEVSER